MMPKLGEAGRGKDSFKIPTGMNVITDIRVIGIEHAGGTVSEPVGIVEIAGFVLAKKHLPRGGMKIAVNRVKDWLVRCVGGRQPLVMGVLVFVVDYLAGGPEQVGSSQSGEPGGVVPNNETIAVRTKGARNDTPVRGIIYLIARTPKDARIRKIQVLGHAAINVSVLHHVRG